MVQKEARMNTVRIDANQANCKAEIELPASKSLLNRTLVLAANFAEIDVQHNCKADDVRVLQHALTRVKGLVDVGAAGTAMRFATAFFAAKPGANITLVGSKRMQKRPIKPLVDALQKLGATIIYTGQHGFPPLQISGAQLEGGEVEIDASVSSQFITALLLVAPTFKKGLTLHLVGNAISTPYVKMTADLMQNLGFKVRLSSAKSLAEIIKIHVAPAEAVPPKIFVAEADWSAAAFWFAIAALKKDAQFQLVGLHENSWQGDKKLIDIFKILGVRATFNSSGLHIKNGPAQLPGKLILNLAGNPDLAQVLAVTCAAMGIAADFRGLQTLPLKETDRLLALKTELRKVGCHVEITDASLAFGQQKLHAPKGPFCTYQDHRMAMSMAVLAVLFPVEIQQPEVVSKSYPDFFKQLKKMDFCI